MNLELLAFIATIFTGLAIVASVLRFEAEQRRTKVYSVAEFNAKFGGVK